jgi:5-formyltetrahydrofolate cyclo-ligase
MIELSKAKKEELEASIRIKRLSNSRSGIKRRVIAIISTKSLQTLLKTIKKKDIIKYCNNNDEATINTLFDRLDSNNEQRLFIESLK